MTILQYLDYLICIHMYKYALNEAFNNYVAKADKAIKEQERRLNWSPAKPYKRYVDKDAALTVFGRSKLARDAERDYKEQVKAYNASLAEHKKEVPVIEKKIKDMRSNKEKVTGFLKSEYSKANALLEQEKEKGIVNYHYIDDVGALFCFYNAFDYGLVGDLKEAYNFYLREREKKHMYAKLDQLIQSVDSHNAKMVESVNGLRGQISSMNSTLSSMAVNQNYMAAELGNLSFNSFITAHNSW